MATFTLKDYRATHFLMRFIRSHLQGWYTRENILLKASHPDGNKEKLEKLARLIDTVDKWNNAIQPGTTPFMTENGTVNKPEQVEDVCKVMQWLFAQHLEMNERLNAILDNPEPLEKRKEDFQYITACIGWVHYSVNHGVHGDLNFAKIFNDRELLQNREGQAEESQKDLDFVNFIFQSFKAEETYNAQTCADLTSIIETLLDTSLKESATQIDKYLRVFGK